MRFLLFFFSSSSSYVVKFVRASTPCLFASSRATMNDSKSRSRRCKRFVFFSPSLLIARTLNTWIFLEKTLSCLNHLLNNQLFARPFNGGEELSAQKHVEDKDRNKHQEIDLGCRAIEHVFVSGFFCRSRTDQSARRRRIEENFFCSFFLLVDFLYLQ